MYDRFLYFVEIDFNLEMYVTNIFFKYIYNISDIEINA